jgi:hypothetical protein
MIYVKSVKRQETKAVPRLNGDLVSQAGQLGFASRTTWLCKPDNLALQAGQLGFASWTTWLRKLDNLASQVGQLELASWTT